MNKLRLLIAFVLVVGIALLAGNHVAWADTANATASDMVVGKGATGQHSMSSQKGSVVPPPAVWSICSPYDVPGVYSIGGVATLHVDELAPGYCIETIIWNRRYATGHLSANPPDFLSDVVFLRIYYAGKLIDTVPEEDGDVSLCFALPPDKTGEIDFYDFYGPRFFDRAWDRSWVPNGTFTQEEDDRIVCTETMASGAYALVEK